MSEWAEFPGRLLKALDPSGLNTPGTVLLAAVSGGADSVAMLCALAAVADRQRLTIIAAHLHHGIRPEADGDAGFVQALCNRLAIGVCIERADVPTTARAAHRSTEMQAREMRYHFLRRMAAQYGALAVLTAHTRDDQAETLLLNLCRGAGPAALGGIPPDRVIMGTRIVRPLLHTTRREIEDYLHAIGQTWREDASNRDIAYRRNAVRHRILPLLNELLNPQASEALARAADLLHADNQLLDDLAAAQCAAVHPDDAGDTLRLAAFRALPAALRRRLLAQWLRGAGIARIRFDQVERIDALARETSGGSCIRISPTLEIRHEYEHLRRLTPSAMPDETTTQPVTLAIPGMTALPSFDCRVDIRLASGFNREPSAIPGAYPAQVHIRYDAGAPPRITVRARRPGDRIAMLGMAGDRKVQDILTDAKIPFRQRCHIPVFTIGDEVIWIPGCRPSRHWAVPAPDAPSLCIRVF